MNSPERDELMKSLLIGLDIPRAKIVYNYVQVIGHFDSGFFENCNAVRKQSEDRVMAELSRYSDEVLLALYNIEGELADFAIDRSLFDPPPWYSAGFGVDIYWPDYKYWAKMDYWTPQEAVCLSLGFKPENGAELKSRLYSRYEPEIPSGPSQLFCDRTAIVKRASFREKNDNKKVCPKVFVSWAKSKGLEVPSEMLTAVDVGKVGSQAKMLSSVDKRQYDSAMKVILGLLASHYGYREGAIHTEMKKDILSGLADLGLSLDPKTLNKLLGSGLITRI